MAGTQPTDTIETAPIIDRLLRGLDTQTADLTTTPSTLRPADQSQLASGAPVQQGVTDDAASTDTLRSTEGGLWLSDVVGMAGLGWTQAFPRRSRMW